MQVLASASEHVILDAPPRLCVTESDGGAFRRTTLTWRCVA